MAKFQVGDTVQRIVGRWGMSRKGTKHIVREVVADGLRFEGDAQFTYSADYYELVRRIPRPPEQPKEVPALTPKEVLQAVVDDVPLQVRSSYSGWVDVVHPERICLKDVDGWKYRAKPSTVSINDTEVVKPKLDNAVKYSQKCYTFAEGLQTVVEVRPAFVADCKLYWDTREDAWAALKVITAILRGE